MASNIWSAETLTAKDGTVTVISAEPRKNSVLEDTLAVWSLLSWFGCGARLC